ncbi:ATPase MipZ [Verrucomicrobium sp. GAS474]|uniref:division plane positioning ATPase MipZ n=1 Tax=Verrucomicrobium sp. GAS474 TaxID=1882831 RepID=UPI00087A7980|nr:division plane positioning ATPase MipZ [Verrucomicrobium sp. GAS474]SDT90509.1 ATPase MipZ [Verrucomicrobium sp. GAS474]
MPTKRLILCPQDKGGIGKSFIATLLYDFLVERGVKVKTFDLDHANSTFQRYVPEAEFIDTDVDADKLAVLDRLVSALETVDTVLVDNRAAGGTKVLRYIEDSRLTELQKELAFELVFVVVAIDDKDAISQAADVLEAYGERVKWLIARNFRDSVELTMWDGAQTRKKLKAAGAVEIDVPCLAEMTKNRLQMLNLTVGRGRTATKLHLLDRSRCVRFHTFMEEQFTQAASHLLA